MEVGTIIYLEPTGNAARGRGGGEIIETFVTHIGRKYFKVDHLPNSRFNINTMNQDCGEYSSNYIAHTSKQELIDKRDRDRLRFTLPEMVRQASINQLRQIEAILNN